MLNCVSVPNLTTVDFFLAPNKKLCSCCFLSVFILNILNPPVCFAKALLFFFCPYMVLAQGVHLCMGISDQCTGSSPPLHMQSSLVMDRENMTFSRVWGCKGSCAVNMLPFSLHLSFQFLLFFRDSFYSLSSCWILI